MSDSVFGLVESTNARYTLIKAYDGRRIIVPNEYFISQKVTNWTYTDCEARVDFTVGVAYESDLELAISIVESISSAHPKSSSEKKSKCYVKEFGESAIQLFCTFWVKDITLGRLGIKSDIILEVHKQFKENNIEISYPKRVVHIRKEENT